MPQLYELINEYYTMMDLRVICVELGIDFENLSGGIRKLKSLSLQESMGNQGRTNELLAALSKNPAIYPELSNFLYLVVLPMYSQQNPQ